MKLITMVLTLLCLASSARAQQAAPEADSFKFNSDAAVMIWTIKADQTEAFESVWNVIRTRLQASPKAELKALAETLLLFKAGLPSTPQGVTYFFVANPASKTTSYSVSPFLLYESGLFERPEADELLKMIQGAIVQVNTVPLTSVK